MVHKRHQTHKQEDGDGCEYVPEPPDHLVVHAEHVDAPQVHFVPGGLQWWWSGRGVWGGLTASRHHWSSNYRRVVVVTQALEEVVELFMKLKFPTFRVQYEIICNKRTFTHSLLTFSYMNDHKSRQSMRIRRPLMLGSAANDTPSPLGGLVCTGSRGSRLGSPSSPS